MATLKFSQFYINEMRSALLKLLTATTKTRKFICKHGLNKGQSE